MKDARLLADLNELQDTPFHEYLKTLREQAVNEVKSASTDRDCSIAVGGLRKLELLIEDIDTARQEFENQRQAAARNSVDMRKAF